MNKYCSGTTVSLPVSMKQKKWNTHWTHNNKLPHRICMYTILLTSIFYPHLSVCDITHVDTSLMQTSTRFIVNFIMLGSGYTLSCLIDLMSMLFPWQPINTSKGFAKYPSTTERCRKNTSPNNKAILQAQKTCELKKHEWHKSINFTIGSHIG